jgi:hypothetical protein
VRIIGFALVHSLTALDHAGKLKIDTEFLDVPVVITAYLKWSDDHENWGIEESPPRGARMLQHTSRKQDPKMTKV